MNRASKSLLCAAAGLSLLTAAGCAADEQEAASESPAPAAPSSAAPTSPSSGGSSGAASDAAQASSGSYADGEYSGTGSYIPPSGKSEDVDVKLTLKDNVVTDLEVEASGKNLQSKQYQREFTTNIQDQVVGKNIDQLDVDKVAGSSLTSQGFNRALDAIRSVAAS